MYGANAGLPIRCKKCGERPPVFDRKSRYGYVKWRWVADHATSCEAKPRTLEKPQ